MKRPLLNQQDRELLRIPDLQYRWDMFLATNKLKREVGREFEPLIKGMASALDAFDKLINRLFKL